MALDCAFTRHPKVMQLVQAKAFRAITVYVGGLGYSGENGLAGFVPEAVLPLLHGVKTDAHQLVEVGLWEERAGGWDIHDWGDYQRDDEHASARTNRARHAAEVRWSRKRAAQLRAVQGDDT